MSEGDQKITAELIELKNKQRAALRREYLKLCTSPYTQGAGHLVDPGVQRFLAMKATKIEHFKETPKTSLRGFLFLVLPFALTVYMFKTRRDKKEANLRAGNVSYRDRKFKFV